MDDIREVLGILKPEIAGCRLTRHTRLMEDLQLSSLDGLGMAAMLESLYGRSFDWDWEFRTVGDLVDYLATQGVPAGSRP